MASASHHSADAPPRAGTNRGAVSGRGQRARTATLRAGLLGYFCLKSCVTEICLHIVVGVALSIMAPAIWLRLQGFVWHAMQARRTERMAIYAGIGRWYDACGIDRPF